MAISSVYQAVAENYSPYECDIAQYYPDVIPFDFSPVAYEAMVAKLAKQKASKPYFMVDNYQVRCVGRLRYGWEWFKGLLGFENRCQENKVSMMLQKFLYFGFINQFNIAPVLKLPICKQPEFAAFHQVYSPAVVPRLQKEMISYYVHHEANLKPSMWNEVVNADHGHSFIPSINNLVFGETFLRLGGKGLVAMSLRLNPYDGLLYYKNEKTLENGLLNQGYVDVIPKQSEIAKTIVTALMTKAQSYIQGSWLDNWGRWWAYASIAKQIDATVEMTYVTNFVAYEISQLRYQNAVTLILKVEDIETQVALIGTNPNLVKFLNKNSELAKRVMTNFAASGDIVSVEALVDVTEKPKEFYDIYMKNKHYKKAVSAVKLIDDKVKRQQLIEMAMADKTKIETLVVDHGWDEVIEKDSAKAKEVAAMLIEKAKPILVKTVSQGIFGLFGRVSANVNWSAWWRLAAVAKKLDSDIELKNVDDYVTYYIQAKNYQLAAELIKRVPVVETQVRLVGDCRELVGYLEKNSELAKRLVVKFGDNFEALCKLIDPMENPTLFFQQYINQKLYDDAYALYEKVSNVVFPRNLIEQMAKYYTEQGEAFYSQGQDCRQTGDSKIVELYQQSSVCMSRAFKLNPTKDAKKNDIEHQRLALQLHFEKGSALDPIIAGYDALCAAGAISVDGFFLPNYLAALAKKIDIAIEKCHIDEDDVTVGKKYHATDAHKLACKNDIIEAKRTLEKVISLLENNCPEEHKVFLAKCYYQLADLKDYFSSPLQLKHEHIVKMADLYRRATELSPYNPYYKEVYAAYLAAHVLDGKEDAREKADEMFANHTDKRDAFKKRLLSPRWVRPHPDNTYVTEAIDVHDVRPFRPTSPSLLQRLGFA